MSADPTVTYWVRVDRAEVEAAMDDVHELVDEVCDLDTDLSRLVHRLSTLAGYGADTPGSMQSEDVERRHEAV